LYVNYTSQSTNQAAATTAPAPNPTAFERDAAAPVNVAIGADPVALGANVE